MSLYNNLNKVQRFDLKELNVIIEKEKKYTIEEVNSFESIISDHLFGVSKNLFHEESQKFIGTLNVFEQYKKGLQS